jgi:hypothetical protein
MNYDATGTSDHKSATMTCVMWCKENLWNVNILYRVHLSNLVFLGKKRNFGRQLTERGKPGILRSIWIFTLAVG